MQIPLSGPRGGGPGALAVLPGDRVGDLQARLAGALGVEPRHVRLVFRAVALRADQAVRGLGLERGGALRCFVSRPRPLGWPAPRETAARDGPAAPRLEALVARRLRFDEAFVRATLRDSALARRLAAADPRLARALADPRLPGLLCALANDARLRAELGRRRDAALLDPECAAEARRVAAALGAQPVPAPRREYARELRALQALDLGVPRATLRRLLARCGGDVGRVLALLQEKRE